ncbi:MAG TPA: L-serine ammonia-lyase, iron-sulfur-dependent, subunit beta [Ruminococcaceae bacterium]|nr:L-serine ammonia-lyase, iron-sulfur-dependent, subunit beta [Oscillospiraceae bacterium]
MNVFDIIGPVMVGPSSSHTAGAARAGKVARQLLGAAPAKAEIILYGSFACTYRGHGTDKAIIGGLLGFDADDVRMIDSFALAKRQGLEFMFVKGSSDKYHPNTAKIRLQGSGGEDTTVVVSSVGGGAIKVVEINGIEVSFSADYYTTVIINRDKAGVVAEMAAVLAENQINIAFMRLFRQANINQAIMVVETDQPISQDVQACLKKIIHIKKVLVIEPLSA